MLQGIHTYIYLGLVGASRMVQFSSYVAWLVFSHLSTGYIFFLLLLICGMLYESGALQDVLHLHDVLARVSLARLCHTISRARALDGKLDFIFSDVQKICASLNE